MVRFFIIAFCFLFLISCTTSGPAIFGKQSLHEQYGKKLSNAGLKETTLGTLWFTEAEKALLQPLSITLPFTQRGYFSADKPRALGLQFSAKRGAKLLFTLNKKPENNFILYAELWRIKTNDKPQLITFFDTAKTEFSFVIEDVDNYILRLQPQLLENGEYTLSIAVAPSLGFPVAGKIGRIGSIWGDARDAGARSHEGIDIFAPKRTPVVASVDGTINRVEETKIGGKVVWLRPKGMNLNIYYAHLDEQLVSSGQTVQAGDTLGLVGNTGNARTTPPHLHFGIYGFGGAVDPYPFVNPKIQKPSEIKNSSPSTNTFVRTSRDVTVENGNVLKKHTPLFITDVSSSFVVGKTPDGTNYQVPPGSIQSVDNQLIAVNLEKGLPLLQEPVFDSPSKKQLLPNSSVKVLGYYNEHRFVETKEGERGWLRPETR